jgi:hypothetical protein
MTKPLIRYRVGGEIDLDAVVEVYNGSSLGERRPTHDRATLAEMFAHANLIVSAWDDARLVGVARTFTDYAHVGYLADIAVHRSHQELGIGVEMIRMTRQRMGPGSSLILLAAPASVDHFVEMGFKIVQNAMVLRAENQLR